MIYDKPPLTLDDQADQLIRRGMLGDRDLMKSRLAVVNYYRLSGYWYPFRNADNSFQAGTLFEVVWQRYAFDRRLRLAVMDAVERIEVAVRSLLAYHHAHSHGAFGYVNDPASLPKLDASRHAEFVVRVRDETARSHERFAQHFHDKYGDAHGDLPVWMATEVMSFGTVLTFFRGASHRVKQAVASVFGMPDVVFDSWLLALNTVRNICAHHGRLWNRENGIRPVIPLIRDYPQWHTPVKVEGKRVFAVLTICRYCLDRVAPQSGWSRRLCLLLEEYPAIPRSDMGFPTNWAESPIWRGGLDDG